MASLSPDGEQTIYRVTQEAIQNIVDHSHLEIFPSVWKATVRPDLSSKNTGIDFETRSKLPIGLWLVGMPKRAEHELDALRLLPGVSTTAGSPINYMPGL
jgi:glucose-6-phosphate-specific signal transduction histidine kinase